jgi:hypothetical protein
MASSTFEEQEVPTSVRMKRALEGYKRMGLEEKVQLLITAGLMTEAEAPDAIDQIRRSKNHAGNPKRKR